jgi:hypothetical protein
MKVEGLSTQYPKLSNYAHSGNFVPLKTKGYGPTEAKGYCPTKDKG